MKTKLSLIVLIFASSFVGIVKGSNEEKKLLDFIFKDYDSRIRPVEDFSSPLNITFFISLLQLIQVDEKQQTITIRLLRSMYWVDYSLKWDAENHGNISQLSLPRGQTWLPDIQLYNSARDEQQAETYIQTIIMTDGGIIDVLPMLFKATCIMDVTWFPFDEQKCPLDFGSWTHSGKFIYMDLALPAADTLLYIDNGEWKLISANGVAKDRVYECCPESFRAITYVIHIKRRSLYYFFTLLIPSGLIGFLAILGFTLSPESGEKLPLGVTILFSLIVFLNSIGESMPANSNTVPLLGTYFNCIMITIALSVVSTIVVNLNVGTVTAKGIEGCWRKLFLNWLPRILFIRQLNTFDHTEHVISSKRSEEYKQQWIFVATVVDRLCLIVSIIFTIISFTVFLIYAFCRK